MRQALHIFAKDVRRFYPELLISLAVTVLFVKYYPQTWGAPGVGFPRYTWVPGTLTALVPTTWWILITRVMHAESLVGDRQFWTTRPYRWPALLGAKCLLVAVFVWAPFVLAQCCLMREAGFHPTHHLWGMVFNLGMATGIILVPVMLLSSVTSSFAKMSLALLLVVIFVAGVGYGSTLLPASSSPDYATEWIWIAFAVALAAIMVWQFATRRTRISRWAVVVFAVGLAGSALAPWDFAADQVYPLAGTDQQAVQIAIKPNDDASSAAIVDSDSGRQMDLQIPLQMAGMAKDRAVNVDLARLEVEGASGEKYSTHWQSVYLKWLPGESEAVVRIKVSRRFFERVKGQPLTIDLSLGMTTLQAGNAVRRTFREGGFELPGGGLCSRADRFRNELSCRSAMRQGPLMLVVTRFKDGECDARGPVDSGTSGSGWIGTLEKDPADFGITSVWSNSLYFQQFGNGSEIRQSLCAGSPLVFVPYTVLNRTRVRVTARAVGLEHFQQKMTM